MSETQPLKAALRSDPSRMKNPSPPVFRYLKDAIKAKRKKKSASLSDALF